MYVSATPADWEVEASKQEAMLRTDPYNGIAEQLVRPTGITDPEIEIRPAKTKFLILSLNQKSELVWSEDVSNNSYKEERRHLPLLKENVKAEYLHSDIITLERSTILRIYGKGTTTFDRSKSSERRPRFTRGIPSWDFGRG